MSLRAEPISLQPPGHQEGGDCHLPSLWHYRTSADTAPPLSPPLLQMRNWNGGGAAMAGAPGVRRWGRQTGCELRPSREGPVLGLGCTGQNATAPASCGQSSCKQTPSTGCRPRRLPGGGPPEWCSEVGRVYSVAGNQALFMKPTFSPPFHCVRSCNCWCLP